MALRPTPLALQHSALFPPSPYQPAISSCLTVPISPMTPRTPLKPPARLQLRTFLPSPPISPSILIHNPPVPYPWVWRCHLCGSVYKLGVTRRCVEDGHFFCSLPTPPSSPEFSTSSSSSSSSGEEAAEDGEENQSLEQLVKLYERERRQQEKRRLLRRRNRSCRAEFDYLGWSEYNVWRREVRLFRSGSVSSSNSEGPDGRGDGVSNVGRDEYRENNCWTDCDFPSECHNYRRERLERVKAARMMVDSLATKIQNKTEIFVHG